MDKTRSFDIDDARDFAVAEALLKAGAVSLELPS
jgi:CMP-N-acetylneuraminic acid synthetase